MELLQLKYFLKVAERESVTQTAKALYISQPALSKTIKNLEKELRIPLFDRVGRKIILNENGRLLFKYAKRACDLLENARLELSDRANTGNHVSASFSALSRHIPHIVLKFKKENPDVNINIQMGSPMTKDTSCDLHIYAARSPAQGDGEQSLLSEECLLALPKGHPLANSNPIDPHDLIHEKFIIVKRHMPLSDITEEICEEAGFYPQIILECDNRDAVFAFIESGMGVSIIPSKTWGPYDTYSRIVYRPLLSHPFRYINLHWNTEKYMTDAVKKFRAYITAYLSTLSYRHSV